MTNGVYDIATAERRMASAVGRVGRRGDLFRGRHPARRDAVS
jgi:hypothetical protein